MTRLTDYLDRRDIGYEVLEHDRTFTGIDEARALGVKADEDIKVVICDTESEHVALVLPSGERLDMNLVRDRLHDLKTTLAEDQRSRATSADSSSARCRRSGRCSGWRRSSIRPCTITAR